MLCEGPRPLTPELSPPVYSSHPVLRQISVVGGELQETSAKIANMTHAYPLVSEERFWKLLSKNYSTELASVPGVRPLKQQLLNRAYNGARLPPCARAHRKPTSIR